jgi:hypothetical protein
MIELLPTGTYCDSLTKVILVAGRGLVKRPPGICRESELGESPVALAREDSMSPLPLDARQFERVHMLTRQLVNGQRRDFGG